VASLARDLKLGETTIARMAVNLAQKATDQEKAPEWQTVCKWLYDDEGRRTLAKALGAAAPRRRMVPDPSGRRASWGIVVLTAVIYAAYLAVTGSLWLAPLGLPLAWGAAMVLIRRCFSVFAKPVELLKLEVKELPDSCRTLAVMPVLLSSKEYAEEICDRIEAMGSVEHDKNIRWLILGDFPDADTQHREEDEIIAATVRRRVAEMNKRMGETRFFYLHRTRRLLERDGIWMGRDRKRGALMALNRLLLDQGTEGTDFLPDEPAFEALRGQFHYVLTLDADTAMLPGTMHRLIGCMLHPLNRRRQIDGEWRGYSVLQPRMEMRAGGCVNGFIRLFSGTGGLHMYGSSVSDFWQDVTGTGIFFGKGLYEVQAFQMSVEGVLPAGKILSHDLIEGMLAGVALVRDVILYDTAPESLAGTLKRLHRWTRGDWQLLPQLASGQMNSSGGRRLCWAERIRLTDNLMRSLWAPSLLALMLQSIWMGSSEGWVLALGASYLHPLLNFFGHDPEKWRRATGELSILPATAFCCADAIIRTLWRLLVSGRHLLNWVTAADAKGGRNTVRLPGRLSVILLLPGWMIPGWRLATLALSMLFLIGPDWIRDLETTGSRTESHWEGSEEDREMLWALARDTWKFFEETTGAASNGLPPDNLQTDPARQAVHRTSPTNIGLYMMSVIAASELKLIDDQAACERLTQTVAALEKMEKWKGHLYNWHDTHTLSPLSPKYVSSVDSGNLAAALLLCAEATADQKELSDRIRTLAEDMDLSALYDPEKRLFRIGLDAECGRLSDGYYDMLASESRILSYTAVMLGQVPVEHWRMLSRTTAAAEGQQVLVSWGGTMFEYLMPELFMEVPPSTLLGQTVRGVVRLQQMAGKRRERPWGISESGYYAFDLYLNYQYRAFGLQGLAMNGRAREDVVAPYASVLALTVSPEEAVENITHMRHMGWWGRYGFYEAADYTETKGEPRLVRSHMAHHQGMILCALAGVLTGRPMRNWFMRNPQARGVALLLEEAPISGRSGRQKKNRAVRSEGRVRSDERIADGRRWIEDTHLLSGGGGMVLLTADGAGYYRKEGLQGSRFGGDLLNRNDGACMHLQDERTGQGTIFGHQKMVYRSGCAVLEARVGTVTGVMRMCVSPEDGAWIRLVELKNQGNRAEEVCVTDCIPLSLGTEGEMYEHPVFRHLFVESKRIAGGAIRHRVRQRSPEKQPPELLHLVSSFGEIRCGTDMDRLTGRLGSVMEPGGIRGIDQRREAAALNPCSVLACRVIVPAGETVTMHFAAGFVYPDAEQEWMERNFAEMTAERSLQLSTMQAVTELEYLGIDAREARMLYRIAALLFDGRLSAREQRYEDREGCSRENLWAAGISGDVPVLLVEIHTEEDIRGFRRILRMHEFYRWLRVPVDLAIVCRFEVHYFRPLADLLGDIIDRSHLGALRGQRGGVHVLEENRETLPCVRALERFATLRFHSGQDPIQALKRALYPLEHPPAEVQEMRLGESCLEPISPDGWNGFGGYLENGSYVIEIAPNRVPPAPWVNMMANDNFGILLTERGGGMIWQGNSRFGRLTAFVNDPLYEGWGWMLYLVDEKRGEFLRLLPGKQPAVAYRVIYEAGQTIYRFETSRIAGETTICVAPEAPELRIRVTVKSAMHGPYRLVGFVDWLMGGTSLDGQMLRTWSTNDACFAAGTWSGVGYFAADHTRVRSGCSRNAFLGRGTVMSPEGILQGGVQEGGWVLNVPIRLTGNESCSVNWVIGCERDAARAQMRVRAFYRAPRYE
ncbi:MAG: glucoamylase family protein, partial [Christensenellales bacterium]|nr:glucoamylase family protein [Christensenellales bacterium]